ncbi:MAG: hypothetical protein ACTHOF_03635 [Flavisolibacter sp.]
MAAIVLVASCNNNATNTENTTDTTEVVDETAIAQQQLAAAFPEEYQFFKSQDSSFTSQKFIETETDTVHNEPALAVSESLQKYYPYFIYNPDSTYAIDLYSYNIVLVTKNGKTIGKAGGPDTEVGLVDIKNNTRRRIYFGGSSSAILNAKWINDNEFLLMTGELIKDSSFNPTILKYTLPSHTLVRFVYDDTLKMKPSEYKDARLQIQ